MKEKISIQNNKKTIKLLGEPESGRRIIRVKRVKQKEKFGKECHQILVAQLDEPITVSHQRLI